MGGTNYVLKTIYILKRTDDRGSLFILFKAMPGSIDRNEPVYHRQSGSGHRPRYIDNFRASIAKHCQCCPSTWLTGGDKTVGSLSVVSAGLCFQVVSFTTAITFGSKHEQSRKDAQTDNLGSRLGVLRAG